MALGTMTDETPPPDAPDEAGVADEVADEGSRAYREVPVETMRRWYQDQQELTSIRFLAAGAGLGRTTLHKFIAGETMPHPRVRRLLAIYYLKTTGAGDPAVALARVALPDLLPGIPEEQAARELEGIFARCGVDPPAWWPAFIATVQEQ